jgi:hypothetical protein
MAGSSDTTVPNRIFLAYQWYIYRSIYEDVCTEIHKTYPVHFYAVGRQQGQKAEDLLEKVKSILTSSTAAVFDASKGNANVSLEYGMTHFMKGMPSYLLIDQHTLPSHVNVGTPIISDLAGSTQNRWDIKDPSTLNAHLRAIAEKHPYTKRFRRYCRDRGLTAGQFRVPLKVIRLFDERESILRREVLDELHSSWGNKKLTEIEDLVADMHKAGLITITRGREWASKVFIA